MFILKGKIQIGEFIFNSINDVEITKSVDDLIDNAVFKMPSNFIVKQNGEEKYTEEAIKVGDRVTITLGYAGKYEGIEFVGFIRSIGSHIPLEIKCEDAIYLLRRKNIVRAFVKTSLKEILKEVVSGTEIKLSKNIPDIAIDKFIIKNANGAQVLQKLKQDFSLSIYLDDDNNLYAGLQQSVNIAKEAIYDLNYNLVENNLDYITEEERKIKIKYTYIDKKNSKKSVEVGDDDGETRTFHTSIISDEKKLLLMANAELKKNKYSGFEGSVKSFLIPFATRGMTAVIRDSEHVNREGSYFIKKVVTTFGTDGARRDVYISNKL